MLCRVSRNLFRGEWRGVKSHSTNWAVCLASDSWEVAEPFSAASGTSCSPSSPPEVFSQPLPQPGLSLGAPQQGKLSWDALLEAAAQPKGFSRAQSSDFGSWWTEYPGENMGKRPKITCWGPSQPHSFLTLCQREKINIFSVWPIWHSQMLTPAFAGIAKASVTSCRTSSFFPVIFLN